jgi:hypothetical protein
LRGSSSTFDRLRSLRGDIETRNYRRVRSSNLFTQLDLSCLLSYHFPSHRGSGDTPRRHSLTCRPPRRTCLSPGGRGPGHPVARRHHYPRIPLHHPSPPSPCQTVCINIRNKFKPKPKPKPASPSSLQVLVSVRSQVLRWTVILLLPLHLPHQSPPLARPQPQPRLTDHHGSTSSRTGLPMWTTTARSPQRRAPDRDRESGSASEPWNSSRRMRRSTTTRVCRWDMGGR